MVKITGECNGRVDIEIDTGEGVCSIRSNRLTKGVLKELDKVTNNKEISNVEKIEGQFGLLFGLSPEETDKYTFSELNDILICVLRYVQNPTEAIAQNQAQQS